MVGITSLETGRYTGTVKFFRVNPRPKDGKTLRPYGYVIVDDGVDTEVKFVFESLSGEMTKSEMLHLDSKKVEFSIKNHKFRSGDTRKIVANLQVVE